MAAPALHRTVGRLAAGGDMPAECGECALDVPAVQRAFSGHRTPLAVPEEVWTQFPRTSRSARSTGGSGQTTNARRRTGNMLYRTSTLSRMTVFQRRGWENAWSSSVTLLLSCELRGRPSLLCSHCTCAHDGARVGIRYLIDRGGCRVRALLLLRAKRSAYRPRGLYRSHGGLLCTRWWENLEPRTHMRSAIT